MACWQQIKFPVIWLLNYNYWQLRANQINTATHAALSGFPFYHNAARDKRGNPVGDTTFGTDIYLFNYTDWDLQYILAAASKIGHSQSL